MDIASSRGNTFIDAPLATPPLVNNITHSGDDVQFFDNRLLDGSDWGSNAVRKFVQAIYTGTNQALMHLGEPGDDRDITGVRVTSNGATGRVGFYGYNSDVMASAPCPRDGLRQ